MLSITPSYAQIKLQEGTRLGQRLEDFKSNIDRPLAAILSLNTIAHTVGAIGVGSQSTKIWGEVNPFVTSFIVPVAMTVAILILSEIIPKTLGANYWKKMAGFTVASLSFILTILAPLVWVCQLVTRNLKADKSKSVFSRSDFLAMAEIGEQEGVFHSGETRFIKSLFHFNSITARNVMTPRVVVKAAPASMTIAEFYNKNKELPFSRIPLFEGGQKDHIDGYVLKTEILSQLVHENGDKPLSAIRRELTAVKEDFPVPELFNRFIEKREHIALVVDSYGGMSGIVTMEDVLETLLGLEIIDELDNAENMQALARKNWAARAKAAGLIAQEEEGINLLSPAHKQEQSEE